MEDSLKNKHKELLERLQNWSFPPAAVAGAFASFAAAATGARAGSGPNAPGNSPLVQIGLSGPKAAPTIPDHFELEYGNPLTLSGAAFRRSLSGIAVGPDDKIFALGDGEVRIFEPGGAEAGKWKAPERASCITLDRDGQVYLGAAGRIEIFDGLGRLKQAFETGDPKRPALITSIKTFDKEILIADAAARCICRYGPDGKRLGEIGNHGNSRGFMLPNRHLDFDVNTRGIVVAGDPGRHRVSSWSREGAPLGHFGKFGLIHPEDFVGCCNPVNLALTPDGKIVTAEKVAARVKVYDTKGKLLAMIGPEHFDLKCIHLHLAVDSKGRILVADPVRLGIKIFSAAKTGGGERV